jgi:hypothetical protein
LLIHFRILAIFINDFIVEGKLYLFTQLPVGQEAGLHGHKVKVQFLHYAGKAKNLLSIRQIISMYYVL